MVKDCPRSRDIDENYDWNSLNKHESGRGCQTVRHCKMQHFRLNYVFEFLLPVQYGFPFLKF